MRTLRQLFEQWDSEIYKLHRRGLEPSHFEVSEEEWAFLKEHKHWRKLSLYLHEHNNLMKYKGITILYFTRLAKSQDELSYGHEAGEYRKLLIESLEWLEHRFDLSYPFGHYCRNLDGGCLKCKIVMRLS